MSMSSKPGEPTEPTRPPSPPFSLSLTKFADRLALPPVLRPAHSRRGADGYASLRVQMRSAR